VNFKASASVHSEITAAFAVNLLGVYQRGAAGEMPPKRALDSGATLRPVVTNSLGVAAPPLTVPTLVATPFRLRGFEMSDLGLVGEASSDPHIPLITTVPAVFSESEGVAFIERQWSRAGLGEGCPFVIAEDGSDRGVGAIALMLRNLDEGRASIGYFVVKSARGHGAATHALRAVAAWGLRELGIPRLELFVEPWNAASIVTAERCGFRREGLLRAWQKVGTERRDMFMYSRLPGDVP
jgi:ribosomal-protein-alanine N-acetyltransferase